MCVVPLWKAGNVALVASKVKEEEEGSRAEEVGLVVPAPLPRTQ